MPNIIFINSIILFIFTSFLVTPAYSQYGGGEIAEPTDTASSQIDIVHYRAVNNARSLGYQLSSPHVVGDRSTYSKLEYPIQLAPHAKGNSTVHISNFVDHDATAGLQDWTCGTRTYDGHRGIDKFLSVGSWWRMDQGSHVIVAAAEGTIVDKHDGEQDRTCGNLATVPNNPANYVVVLQTDGLYAYYWHMKTGSVTPLAIGTAVKAGDYLGLIGSSGFSTGPHLHLEFRAGLGGATVDPYEGVCTTSPSVWKHQWKADSDFRITEVSTHSAPPSFATCTNNVSSTDTTYYKNSFSSSERVYMIGYLRDLFADTNLKLDIYNPSGTLVWTGNFNTGAVNYSSSYWYFYYDLPASPPAGRWRYRFTAGTQVAEGAFMVNMAPANVVLLAAALPGGRSVQTGTTATIYASVVNTSGSIAYGCGIYPQTPLAGEFWFQETNPATNLLQGTQNTLVDIPANSTQTFAIGFMPEVGTESSGVATHLRYKCLNGDAAPSYIGVNTMALSFDDDPVPDVIPIAVTATNDLILWTNGTNVTGTWYAAAINIGISATINVSSIVPDVAGITTIVCETDSFGVCLGPSGSNISVVFTPNVTKTFKITVNSATAIPFDPANNKSILRFEDAGGLRGETGVAVTTNTYPGP